MAGIDPAKLMQYPKELTNKDWQKKKGVGGKMTKTGLGAVLDKAEAAHKKIDWTKLDPNSDSPKTKADIEKAVAASKAYYKKNVEPLTAELNKVKSTAENAARKLEKTATGKSAGKAAKEIAKAADQFAVGTKSIDLEALVAKSNARVEKLNKLADKMLDQALKKWIAGQKAYLASDQTVQDWEAHIKQNGRSVSNSVKQLEAYNKKFWKDFSKFQGFDLATLKLSDDEEATKAKRAKVVKLANAQVKEIASFKPA